MTPPNLVDTHSHIFLCKRPIDEILTSAKAAGVSHMVSVGLNIETSQKVVDLALTYPQLLPTVGIHPEEIQDASRLPELESLIKSAHVYAIGEIGLDYYHTPYDKEAQIALFLDQLALAKTYGLPAIIHNRNADEDTLTCIKQFPDVKKVFHCFCSDRAFVKEALPYNSFFSFTGLMTTKRGDPFLPVIKTIPLDRLMIETDCPYLTPQAFRGQENQPAFIGEVAKVIATVLVKTEESIALVTTQTAKRFFNF